MHKILIPVGELFLWNHLISWWFTAFYFKAKLFPCECFLLKSACDLQYISLMRLIAHRRRTPFQSWNYSLLLSQSDMKCCLMSDVSVPVPSAWGRSSLALNGIRWHLNGLFIPINAFTAGGKSRIGQQNPEGGRSDKAQLFMVSLVVVKEERTRGAGRNILSSPESNARFTQEHITIWKALIRLIRFWGRLWWTIKRTLTKQKREKVAN